MDNQNFNQQESNNSQVSSNIDKSNNKKKIWTIIGIIVIIAILFIGYFLLIDKESEEKLKDEIIGQTFDKEAGPKKPKDETPGQTFNGGTEPNVLANISLAKRLIKPEDIISTNPSVEPQVPEYSLPLEISNDIANWDKFSNKIRLSDPAKQLLSDNGFVVAENNNIFYAKEDFANFYSEIENKDLPIFITTDSLLHYYHVFFDTSLLRMEKDIFYNDVWEMTKNLYNDSLNTYQNSNDTLLKEAAKKNVAYLAVVLELLKPKFDQIVSGDNVKDIVDCNYGVEYCEQIYEDTIQNGTFKYFGQKEAEKYSFNPPNFVKDLVNGELKLISDHKGWKCSPIFSYEEDYSQYVPRGHYTKTEKLKNYFKAFMWYGRMTGLIKGSDSIDKGQCISGGAPDGFISSDDAKIQTLQASILARKFAIDSDIQENWKKIYLITAFYVGFSDDLGPIEYSSALEEMFGDEVNIDSLSEKIISIQKTINNKFSGPQIYSGLGNAKMIVPKPPLTEEQINELKKQMKQLLANTKGFRMMGQRFVVDSQLFSDIVSPYSGEYTGPENQKPFTYVVTEMGREVRGFPRGLDIMALFGSERAKEIIKDLGDDNYSDYESKFNNLKEDLDNISEEKWRQNLYWNWFYVLKSLIDDFGSGYPTFMQTDAWQDKELNTALASWAELRHDTILYAKQSYTGAEMGGFRKEEPKIVGYVEPVPMFYSRLLDLTKMTKKGLNNLLTQDELDKIDVGYAMNDFETILTRLVDISKDELENNELSDDDYDFIKHFGSSLESISSRLLATEGDADPDMFKTTLISDVHTDGNTKKVLEEGVGYVKPVIVAYKLPGDYILAGVGPVFSYYEFKHPMKDRLTDEEWRNKLKTNPPSEPEWIKSFSE